MVTSFSKPARSHSPGCEVAEGVVGGFVVGVGLGSGESVEMEPPGVTVDWIPFATRVSCAWMVSAAKVFNSSGPDGVGVPPEGKLHANPEASNIRMGMASRNVRLIFITVS